VLDASNPAAPAFRLVWSAKIAGGVASAETASFEVTRCAPGLPPSEAACAQSMTTVTIDASDAWKNVSDASHYSLDVPQTGDAPVVAFVSLTAVAGDGAKSAPLGPFRETANYGASADGARDNAARVFISPDASGVRERGRERVRRALDTLRGPDRRARRRRRLGRDVHRRRARRARVPPRRTQKRRELRG
jgi:hypothetical protein